MPGAENLQFLAIWRIKNFSLFGIIKDQSQQSITFKVPFLENTEWFLKLVFTHPQADNVMCFLCRNDEGPEYVKFYYSISVGSSYVADLQTLARNSPCFNHGLINRGKFIEDVFRGRSKDVLLIECRLWPDTSSEVPIPSSPFPVGIEMGSIVPTETRSLFYKIPNFSNFPEGQVIEFSTNSAGNGSRAPKIICRLWMEQETVRVLVQETNDVPVCYMLKCNVHLLDAFRDQHFLYHGSTVINNGGDSLSKTLKFSLAMSKKQLMEKKDLYLPDDELLLHWEFAYSLNSIIWTSVERTLYDEPSNLQVKRKLKWGIYLERKYSEHRFFFRLLAFLAVLLSVLPHLLFDTTP